jgi:hypothetical protein
MNPRIRTFGLVALLAALLLGFALPQPAAAAPTCTTDCYVSPTGNDTNDGATAATPLKSIQLAIDTVSAGGTVHLAAGTYFENAPTGWRELYITKSMTLMGAGSGATIIELPMKTNGLEIYGSNLNVTLEGLTFTKQTANTNAANFNVRVAEVASSFTAITFEDVESAYATSQNVSLGSAGTYTAVTVEDSNFHHSGSWGFSIAGAASNVTVTDSHFDNNGTATPAQAIGLNLTAGAGISNVQITGGTFNNNGVKTTNGSKGINMVVVTNVTIDGIEAKNNFDGVILWEFVGTSSNVDITDSNLTGNGRGITLGSETGKTIDGVTITGNTLSGNNDGVLIYRAPGWGDGVIKNVDINRNDLSSNPSRGINVVMPYEEVDGTCNWWGAANGPGPVGPGSGSKVTAGVDFTPWLYTSDLTGPCYVGGTIAIDKVAAGGGALEFEFDVSWSNSNVKLTDAAPPYVTAPPLQPGNYTITEVNLPLYWVPVSASCDNTVTTPVETVNPANITVADGDAWVCTFTNRYAPSSTCPVNTATSQWTDLLGIGMGSTKAHKTQAKLVIPNSANLVELYGQLVAKSFGEAKQVRFIQPGKNNYVEVSVITSPEDNINGTFWYGADLPVTAATKSVTGKWWLLKGGVKNHIPRAFLLYPTYNDPANTYVNVWDTFDAAEGEVYWEVAQGWTPTRVITVPITAPLGPETFHIELAVVDNDKDNRPVWVTVTAGGVTQTVKPTAPNKGDLLNLLVFDLANVPAGTDEIIIEMYSPSPTLDGVYGESASLVGMAANYQCSPMATD